MALDIWEGPLAFIKRLEDARDLEAREAQQNPFLAEALEREKYEGHQLAFFVRAVALAILAVLIPILTPQLHMLFYVGVISAFILIGWLQLRAAKVGQSRLELVLIFADIALLTMAFIVPNPFHPDTFPTAFTYRFDNFMFFFLFLAFGMLAYSWRTVWAMGTWIAIAWLFGLIGVYFFGHTMPALTESSDQLYATNETMRWGLDPNGLQLTERIEEIVLVIMVGIILGLKGARTNRLLIQQARVAAERANLSRYFPTSLVDTLASTDHDIGAVRDQDVAVLFTDIVGFTEYAERSGADEVMELLRTYHSLVEKTVFENDGTLDKFLGDGAMATFGTPEAGPHDARNALAAARAILSRTEELNEDRKKQNLEPVRVSVGLHFGTVTLGDIGSARRLEFAVIGDTVNVASRLETVSRDLGCRCVVSDELMQRASKDSQRSCERVDGFEPRHGVRLKGRQTPIDVWTV